MKYTDVVTEVSEHGVDLRLVHILHGFGAVTWWDVRKLHEEKPLFLLPRVGKQRWMALEAVLNEIDPGVCDVLDARRKHANDL